MAFPTGGGISCRPCRLCVFAIKITHWIFVAVVILAGCPGAYSIADYAADVIAFIEKNFTEPVDLLGHSLGAHVSLVVANAIPKHIRSVILEDLPVWTADGRLQGRPFSQYSRLGVISWGRPKISTRSIICLAKVNIPEIPSVIAFGPNPWPCWTQMFLMPTFCAIPMWDMIRKL
jgi:pimeloyl-ACP methyl ester carboxylesterase